MVGVDGRQIHPPVRSISPSGAEVRSPCSPPSTPMVPRSGLQFGLKAGQPRPVFRCLIVGAACKARQHIFAHLLRFLDRLGLRGPEQHLGLRGSAEHERSQRQRHGAQAGHGLVMWVSSRLPSGISPPAVAGPGRGLPAGQAAGLIRVDRAGASTPVAMRSTSICASVRPTLDRVAVKGGQHRARMGGRGDVVKADDTKVARNRKAQAPASASTERASPSNRQGWRWAGPGGQHGADGLARRAGVIARRGGDVQRTPGRPAPRSRAAALRSGAGGTSSALRWSSGQAGGGRGIEQVEGLAQRPPRHRCRPREGACVAPGPAHG